MDSATSKTFTRRRLLQAGGAALVLLQVKPAAATPEHMAAAIARSYGDRRIMPGRVKIALTVHGAEDPSVATNFPDLQELVAPVPVMCIPHLKDFRAEANYLREAAEHLRGSLGVLLEP